MTVGGYTSALLDEFVGVELFYCGLPVAGLVAGLVGLLFGLPSLRVKGFYLVMATLAAQFIIPWVTRNLWKDVLNGAQGINVPVPEIVIPVVNDLCLFGTTFNAETGAVARFVSQPRLNFIYITLVVLHDHNDHNFKHLTHTVWPRLDFGTGQRFSR